MNDARLLHFFRFHSLHRLTQSLAFVDWSKCVLRWTMAKKEWKLKDFTTEWFQARFSWELNIIWFTIVSIPGSYFPLIEQLDLFSHLSSNNLAVGQKKHKCVSGRSQTISTGKYELLIYYDIIWLFEYKYVCSSLMLFRPN